jgi:hypothetical protein
MPVQVTVSDALNTTNSRVARRLLIEGRLVAVGKAVPWIDPITREAIGSMRGDTV